jgi:hypothetical protein
MIWQILLELLKSGISPALRALFEKLLNDWEKAAAASESPLDDIIVAAIKVLLGFKANS